MNVTLAGATIAHLVVMGVSGSGKTTVGMELARRLGREFIDGDDLHPAANIAKMASGVPLSDEDRWPWLDAVGDVLRGSTPIVVACSALRRSHRDRLRRSGEVVFVFLDADGATIEARLRNRSGHFMPPALLASQLWTLERPEADETDVLSYRRGGDVGQLIDAIVAELRDYNWTSHGNGDWGT